MKIQKGDRVKFSEAVIRRVAGSRKIAAMRGRVLAIDDRVAFVAERGGQFARFIPVANLTKVRS